MLKRLIYFLFWMAALPGYSGVTSRSVRDDSLEYFLEKNESAGVQKLTDALSGEVSSCVRLSGAALKDASVVADCIHFLNLVSTRRMTEESAGWILNSEERLRLLVESVSPADQIPRCFKVIDELRRHDPAGCDEWYELILALSVVWDHPKRPWMHRQMGEDRLAYQPEICRRYDYFKAIYADGDARVPYDALGVAELIYVVDTPVPVSELEWARAQESGNLEDWGEKYSSIEYDNSRLVANQYVWPQGSYTLAAIRERGGICVDQTYYAVMTARAFGIPAIYFSARGTAGGHAWFSFMKAPGDWALDVGRYVSQNYTTGFAVNPQSNELMTDHDVAYTCERSLRSDKMDQACAYVAIADALRSDKKNALRCAREARRLVQNYLRAWSIETDLLLESGDFRGVMALFAEQRAVFKDHPDILVDASERIEKSLRASGRDEEAEEIQRSLVRNMDEGRDDLCRSFGQDKIKAFIAEGKVKQARRAMEKLLEDQVEEGFKVFPLIQNYLRITQETGQDKAAARFLEEYVEELEQRISFYSDDQKRLLEYLAQAYENNGDDKRLSELQVRIDRL